MRRTVAACLIAIAGTAAPAAATPLVVASVARRHHCLEIPAMRTSEAAAAVTGALRSLPGVVGIAVDPRTQLVVVHLSPLGPSLREVLSACEAAGFPAREYRVESRFPPPIRVKGG